MPSAIPCGMLWDSLRDPMRDRPDSPVGHDFPPLVALVAAAEFCSCCVSCFVVAYCPTGVEKDL